MHWEYFQWLRDPQLGTREKKPRCVIIAGPNGSGKTTFAREYLPKLERSVHFINADLIAAGLSPFNPHLAAIAASRLVLSELKRLVALKADFAFESTLSGLGYAKQLKAWKKAGYDTEIVFLRLSSSKIAVRRVAARVKQGGHDVPKIDIERRLVRGWTNFKQVYQPLADVWTIFDNSGASPRLLERGP